MPLERWSVRVTGIVQGVGFRPFVHGLATERRLTGFVGNDDAGVFVEAQGLPVDVRSFVSAIRDQSQPPARVDSVSVAVVEPLTNEPAFRIVASRRSAHAVTLIPPDTATCDRCLVELADPGDRRYRYPFTACTYCGPRFTIVTGLPYDRPQTTMARFPLCQACQEEYADPTNRRFHAQPTCCPACGPQLHFRASPGGEPLTRDDALAAALAAIHGGRVVAVKGVGGYHLVCDASRPEAVQRLRARKRRGRKPFAVMASNLGAAEQLVALSVAAREALGSSQAPIVVAPALETPHAQAVLRSVAPGQRRIGVMLPYSPLHTLLFAPHATLVHPPPLALVMTSGNRSDEPLCIDPDEAEARLADLADGWLHHDRPIHVACDDSVVSTTRRGIVPVRRSRGFAPLPVELPLPVPDVLAIGGELKATLGLGTGRRAWLSQHVGDVAQVEALDLLDRTADTLVRLARADPQAVVADLHPGYLSRRFAEQRAASTGADLILVQHHHAHLASLLAEHGAPPDHPVIGFTFDGTGYGTDGTIWGGEVLVGSYRAVERVGHVSPIPLPGGDAAIRHPLRSALAHLHAAGIAWADDLNPVREAQPSEVRIVGQMLERRVGCVPTTSMGRVFDAMASVLGVCQVADFEGEGAMALEGAAEVAADGTGDGWEWEVEGKGTVNDPLVLKPDGALRRAVAGVRSGQPTAEAAAAFHQGLAMTVCSAAVRVRAVTGIDVVGLTGGVFQNVRLTEACLTLLEHADFRVLTHRVVPPNDGGLALGQLAVAGAGGGQRRRPG